MISPALVRVSEAATLAGKRVRSASLERSMAARLKRAFRQQGQLLVRHLGSSRVMFPTMLIREAMPSDIWDPIWVLTALESLTLFEQPISEFTAAAFQAGLRTELAQMEMGVSFAVPQTQATAYLAGHGADLVTVINETTRGEVRKILARASDEGWSYQRTGRTLKARFETFASGRVGPGRVRSRADMIAVTEVGNAYEAGAQAVGQELEAAGIGLEKLWLTVSQNNVCPICKGNRAQGWIPFSRAFGSGHLRPLSHPSCRCTLLTRRAGSKVGIAA